MRVAFVVGHHQDSKGAFSPYLGLSEWDFYNKVLSYMDNPNVFYHNPNTKGYTERVKETAKKINKIDFDLVICLHFNSSENRQANGCETLYYFNSQKSRDFAYSFSETVSDWTNIRVRNNGLKALTQSKDRGFAAVYYTKAPTILIEPFFGSNQMDCSKIVDAENMACILNEFINKY